MTEKLTENYSDLFAETQPLEHPAQSTESASPATPVAAAAKQVSFLGWMFGGMRASFLMRPRIALDAIPGPWQLAFLVLIANALDVLFDWISLDGEVRFNYQGWLAQWSLCLFMLWFAWVFMPRKRIGAAAATGRVVAWFALQSWALVVPLLVYYSVMYWIKVTDDSAVPTWLDDFSMSLIATLWMFMVFSKLSRVYFEGWMRALVMTLVVFTITAMLFATADAETWLAADDDASQVEVVPGDEESDDGNSEEEEDFSEDKLLEAALQVRTTQST